MPPPPQRPDPSTAAPAAAPRPRWNARGWSAWGASGAWGDGDRGLSALLVVQALSLFVVLPFSVGHVGGRVLRGVSDLAFAAVAAVALTRRHTVRAALLAALAVLLVLSSGTIDREAAQVGIGPDEQREIVSVVAFGFNVLVTALVVRRVFGPGRVTGHRVQGAVLIYLNVAALFAIAYGVLEAHAPGAIVPSTGGRLADGPGVRPAALTYFSLATVTTLGYGDLVPVHALARSLATLEAVFGQLFPATLLARLVALHLAQRETVGPGSHAPAERLRPD